MALSPYIEAYGTKEVSFKFRGRSYLFSLSQELFSSAGIDTGSRFLLKVFSDYLEGKTFPENLSQEDSFSEFPISILDAGCGAGVLGICAAGALSAITLPRDSTSGTLAARPSIRVRTQDRDELARLFTEYNARRNGLLLENFEAHTEPLLAFPPGQNWDLILTNIPAKAGLPVLEDFIRRSARVLKKDGRVFLVAVNTLADFFRSRIAAAEAPLITEETGTQHTVFVYGPANEQIIAPIIFDEKFPHSYPFYIRNRSEYEMEDVSYSLDTVHGAPDFDNPGGAVQAAAKLAVKINLGSRLKDAVKSCDIQSQEKETCLLIHDAGQGHFALWLSHYLASVQCQYRWVLSGRNILALAAARAALAAALYKLTPDSPGIAPSVIPVADIFLENDRLGAAVKDRNGFSLITFFPETTADAGSAWEGLKGLSAPGGIAIVGMSSAEAERFDRKKPPLWRRMGDIKRKGFRAIAYEASNSFHFIHN